MEGYGGTKRENLPVVTTAPGFSAHPTLKNTRLFIASRPFRMAWGGGGNDVEPKVSFPILRLKEQIRRPRRAPEPRRRCMETLV